MQSKMKPCLYWFVLAIELLVCLLTYTYNTHTQIRPKTLNPQWKERFELRMYDGDSTTLHMEVWDRDFPQSDDFIGG